MKWFFPEGPIMNALRGKYIACSHSLLEIVGLTQP